METKVNNCHLETTAEQYTDHPTSIQSLRWHQVVEYKERGDIDPALYTYDLFSLDSA